MSRLVILGRDGVINQDPGHAITDAEAWLPIPGSLEAIARLSQAGYRVAVATNQPGLASGELDLDALNAIHRKLHDALDRLGGQVAAIAVCPHAPGQACECRKPSPHMLGQLAERFGAAPADVVVIGARSTDLAAADSLGARGLRVLSGTPDAPLIGDEEACFDDLAHAASALLTEE